MHRLKKTENGLTKLCLTEKIIDCLQNYYGMAIRSNVGNLDTTKKAIFAVLFHVCSPEKNNYHMHCPPGAHSWCTYQLDLVNITKLHKPGKGLPQEAIKHQTSTSKRSYLLYKSINSVSDGPVLTASFGKIPAAICLMDIRSYEEW